MGKCPLCYFDTHCKCCFLEAVTDILHGLSARCCILCGTHEAGEGKVHSLYRVGKRNVGPFLCHLFNDWASWVREIMAAGKLIQCVPKADVQCLTENTVTAVQEAEYLRVCS